jgi:hypothetical protein
MSLKSRKSIDMAGPEPHTEISVSFRRNADGTYTKVTATSVRDWKTNQIRKGRVKPVEVGPYILTLNPDEADESLTYEDVDETIKYMHFKLIQHDELTAEDEL